MTATAKIITAILHNLLDFSVRELVKYRRFQPAFQTHFSLDLGPPAREKVLHEAFIYDNVGMTSEFCTQKRYDHRLRDLVRSSGNINLATQLGVPRSTAHSWQTSNQVEIVTINVFDMDIHSLQKEVLVLRRRIKWIVALFRLVVVVMKVSGWSSIDHFPSQWYDSLRRT